MRLRRESYLCFCRTSTIQAGRPTWRRSPDAMKDEYETIVASGLDLQLDCPDLALSRHMLFADLSDEEFVKIAESHIASA